MRSNRNEEELLVTVDELMRHHGKVNIYGAGAFGRALVQVLDDLGITIEHILDRSAGGPCLNQDDQGGAEDCVAYRCTNR